jgi:hypothetical protein
MFTIAKQTASKEDLIQEKVKDFMQQNKMFTSVDICNSIKIDGTWIHNKEVAIWLRSNFYTLNDQNQFAVSQITVGQNLQANLYHPVMANPFDYKDTNQKALTPDDFKSTHKFDATVSKASTIANSPIAFNSSGTGRIRIPAEYVKEVGLNPGDTVNPSLFSVPVSSNLKVHKDGRISISRKSVPSLPTDVKIFVWNKIIHIDKR